MYDIVQYNTEWILYRKVSTTIITYPLTRQVLEYRSIVFCTDMFNTNFGLPEVTGPGKPGYRAPYP